jgi:hypothetical protein
MSLRRLGVTVAAAVGIVVLPMTPALGCSVIEPAPFVDVIVDAEGVYRQETVARAPGFLLFWSESTASVVSRYWGEPPSNTGVQYEGGEWKWSNPFTVDSCEGLLDDDGHILTPDRAVGTLGYGVASESDHRDAPWAILASGGRTGDLSSEELSVLQSVLGPPVTVDHSTWTLIQATALVWWRTVLAYALVILLVVWIGRRYRRNAAEQRERVLRQAG